MPANDHLKRLMIETIADNINEMVIGFDSTPATSSDGAAGRPAVAGGERAARQVFGLARL